MNRIHPTALVDAGAVLADGVEIGPWCVVGPGVSLAEDVRLVSHVVVQQDTSIEARTIVHPFCVIGGDPQHGGYKGEPVRLEISVADADRTEPTPARQQAQAADERLKAAEQAIDTDPAVLAMRDIFGATVQPGSVKPLN